MSVAADDNAFLRAISRGDLETVKRLGTPERCSQSDDFGIQPIHNASAKGHVPIVEWLHSQGGVPLDVQAHNGCQAMHFACAANKMKVADWLHAQGVAYDVKDNYGNEAKFLSPSLTPSKPHVPVSPQEVMAKRHQALPAMPGQ